MYVYNERGFLTPKQGGAAEISLPDDPYLSRRDRTSDIQLDRLSLLPAELVTVPNTSQFGNLKVHSDKGECSATELHRHGDPGWN